MKYYCGEKLSGLVAIWNWIKLNIYLILAVPFYFGVLINSFKMKHIFWRSYASNPWLVVILCSQKEDILFPPPKNYDTVWRMTCTCSSWMKNSITTIILDLLPICFLSNLKFFFPKKKWADFCRSLPSHPNTTQYLSYKVYYIMSMELTLKTNNITNLILEVGE